MDRNDWLGVLGGLGALYGLKQSGLGNRWKGPLQNLGKANSGTQTPQQNYDFSLPSAFKYDQQVSRPAVAPPVQMTPPAMAPAQQKQTADSYNRDMRDMYQLAMLQQMNGNQNQQDGGVLGAAQQIANAGLMNLYMKKMFPQQ